jgi:hypothetical protein
MASKKPAKPNFTGSLADYKTSVAKPKGIAEDIVGGIKNLTAPWQSTKPGELSQVTTTKAVIREGAKLLDQSLAGGMISAGAQGRGALAKQAGINILAAGAGYAAGKVGPTLLSKLLPAKIGVHHSVTPTSGNPFTGKVQTSVANKGLTAMDQKPGYSYFWDTGKGKSGIAKAVSEADFQTKQIADKILLDKGQKAVGYVTKIPRGAARPDTNVPGTIARELKGTQKIVGTVKASGPDFLGMTSFSQKNLKDLSRAVQVAKQQEFVKSAAKIGTLGAAITVGATKRPRNK